MENHFPEAKMDYLPNGQMYWLITLHPTVCSNKKGWTVVAAYNPDHPCLKYGGSIYGGSVKVYPIRPNYEEMLIMMRNAGIKLDRIPGMNYDFDKLPSNPDEKGQHIFNVYVDNKGYPKVIATAVSYIREVLRFVEMFEEGLINPEASAFFNQSF